MDPAQQLAPPALYRFGGFVLDPARGTLLGPEGKEIGLRPKAAEVLHHLTEKAGRVVPREELMHAVWPDVLVTDDSITQCVTEIRRALGQEGAQLLRTLPKRGYLLAAEVSRGTAPARPAGPGGGVPDGGLEGVPGPHRPAPPDRASLVVLPFANLSGDPEQEYFADGMTEELTTVLSRIRWLFVTARNSAFTYKGQAVDARRIGRELGVRYLLEGSIRKSDGRIRITCQLIEAETGMHVWADRLDGNLNDIFDLQDRVAEAVAGAIEPSLRQAEVERARRKPTESLHAYDLYLRALPHHYAQTKPDSDAALGLLRRAAALDPSFALARAFAAYTIVIREIQGYLEPGEREEGARFAREALSDAGDDPATLRCAGQAIAWFELDRKRGLAAVERALALNPNSAQALSGAAWTLLYLGRAERSIELFRRAIRLSPLNSELSYFLSGLAYACLMARRLDEALDAAEGAVAEMPQRATGHRAVVAALVALGRMEEARAAALRFRQMVPSGARVFAARVAAVFTDPGFVETMAGGLRAADLPE